MHLEECVPSDGVHQALERLPVRSLAGSSQNRLLRVREGVVEPSHVSEAALQHAPGQHAHARVAAHVELVQLVQDSLLELWTEQNSSVYVRAICVRNRFLSENHFYSSG